MSFSDATSSPDELDAEFYQEEGILWSESLDTELNISHEEEEDNDEEDESLLFSWGMKFRAPVTPRGPKMSVMQARMNVYMAEQRRLITAVFAFSRNGE
jgi:hypothetical protein